MTIHVDLLRQLWPSSPDFILFHSKAIKINEMHSLGVITDAEREQSILELVNPRLDQHAEHPQERAVMVDMLLNDLLAPTPLV